MNTYQAKSAYALAVYGDDVFERQFTVEDERDLVAAGHIVIVPRMYRCLVDNFDAAGQDEVFTGAYPIENEAALVSGGVIERVDAPAPAPKKRAAAKRTARTEG